MRITCSVAVGALIECGAKVGGLDIAQEHVFDERAGGNPVGVKVISINVAG